MLLTRVQMIRLRIITGIAQQPANAGDLRSVIQQRFEILVIRPRAAISVKAQGQMRQTIAQNRELGKAGLLVAIRLLSRAFVLFGFLPAFAKMMRRLAIFQAGRIKRSILEPLSQQLFFRASFTVDSSKDFAEENFSSRLEAF
jgi:hypothetical protein